MLLEVPAQNEVLPMILIVGGVIFCVIKRVANAVQPFAPVATTVYVPAAVTFCVLAVPNAPAELDHAKLTPEPPAVSVIFVVRHVKALGPEIVSVGAAMFCVTTTLAVVIQPFAVTVTV